METGPVARRRVQTTKATTVKPVAKKVVGHTIKPKPVPPAPTQPLPLDPAAGAGMLGAYPIEAGMPGSLQALNRPLPQINATNQTGVVTGGGTLTQSVDNNNVYHNNYYNVGGNQLSPGAMYPSYSYYNSGTMTGVSPGWGWGGNWGYAPWMGAAWCGCSEGGIIGAIKRFFRGW